MHSKEGDERGFLKFGWKCRTAQFGISCLWVGLRYGYERGERIPLQDDDTLETRKWTRVSGASTDNDHLGAVIRTE